MSKTMTSPIPAKFAGKCARTGQRYEAGTPIINRGGKWELFEAQPAHAPTEPQQKPAHIPMPTVPKPMSYGPGLQDAIHFASAYELIEAAETAQCSHMSTERRPSRDGDYRFNKTRSFGEAITLARHGWRDGVEAILEAAKTLPAIKPYIPDDGTAPGWSFDVSGDELDVSRYLDDEPECFLVRQPTEGEGKIIKISVSIGMRANISAKAITRRGALICAIIQALEASGYNVEVDIRSCVWFDSGRSFTVTAPFKPSDQPLELDSAAFFLTHPSTLRRLVFAIRETQHDCGHMGYSQDDMHSTPENIYLPAGKEDEEEISPTQILKPFIAAGLLA